MIGSLQRGIGGDELGGQLPRAAEEIRSRGADATAARVFGLAAGSPVLEVRRVAYTFGNRPIEVRRSQVDTRHHHYRIDQGEEI